MLCHLSIRDVVLIERLDLTFQPGLGVLTGETGAGKSILLDALGLALGLRADVRLVRHGQDAATVTAEFALADGHPARALLAEHGIDGTGEGLLLRRVLNADGRSRAFVNDQPVSVGLLKRLGDSLVEIVSQFESQRLLDVASHRGLLDAYGGHRELLAKVRNARQAWRAAAEAVAAARARLDSARRDEEYLRHALAEITGLDPKPGEESALAGQRQLLMHAEKLIEAGNHAIAELSDGRGVETALLAALRHLERVAERAEGRLDPAIEALGRAVADVTEAAVTLDKAVTSLDLDPKALEAAEERLFALRALSRKHKTDVDGLAARRDELAQQLAALDDGGAALARLERDETAARVAFVAAAEALTKARRAAARRLDKAVAAEIGPLRLGKATFTTRVEALPEADWGEEGCDRVAFEVATNPGTPPGPLHRIASGGELARFMLALKAVLAEADPVPTLVFDEVDSGIGGAVAAAVGDRLARLAKSAQVLVVTHSPQVAARGDRHWRVAKGEAKTGVVTTVEALDAAARREEIARMLAGAKVTDEARAAAVSLLEDGAA
jgi:DNA repair protein RecN (Recombination protein N)